MLGCLRAARAACGSLADVPWQQAQRTLAAGARRFSQSTEPTPTALLRNFAIIAHVDHGKTTLMDKLLFHQKPSEEAPERAMDSGVFERERGITITSKYTSFAYKDYVFNGVDSPGHADFGGEVERILGMVDGCLLVVDVSEGPMAQTKFVLSKALQLGLNPLVVLNKMDRPTVTRDRCDLVHSELFDLFGNLGASDSQLDFPIVFASGKGGWASMEYPEQPGKDMTPLLDAIVEHVPCPRVQEDAPLSMLVTMVEDDTYLGRMGVGRIASGAVREGDPIKLIPLGDSPPEQGKVTRMMKRVGASGLQTRPGANAGDIVSISGLQGVCIGSTICHPSVDQGITPGQIDPPTLSMEFAPNSSPIGRLAGNVVTAQRILERLESEAFRSVSLKVNKVPGNNNEESVEVQGRGELQLGLLIEGMRRDKFELEISAPTVLMRREGGKQMEPVEEVACEVPSESIGDCIAALQVRKGLLQDMQQQESGDRSVLKFRVPTRGLIGFKTIFTSITRGEGILNRSFLEYAEYAGPMDRVRKGNLISMADGTVTNYALNDLQARGVMFVREGDRVYSGMIVGESNTEDDLQVNPAKEKKLTNVRTKSADEKIILTPPRIMTLEDCIGFIQPGELVEVTPDAIRLRKVAVTPAQRKALKMHGM